MKMKRLKKPRFLFVYPLAVAFFLLAQTSEWSLRVGTVIVMLGEVLRLWANGYVGHLKVNWTQTWRGDAKIGQLITAGPYAYVRHPLYLGTFIIGMGFCVIVGNVWLGLAALACFLFIYRRKMADEEVTLRHEYGDEFGRYERAVPQWIPFRRRYPGPPRQWSWKGIAASREPKTLIWVTVLVILLYFREELVQRKETLWGEHGAKHIVLLGLVIALVATDAITEVVRRWRKRQGGRIMNLPGTL